MSDQPLAVFALLSALCCSAQEVPKIANPEQKIRALETVRLKSPTKTEVWSGNVGKAALFHLGDGTVLSKEDLLARMHRQTMEDSLEMSDTMFRQIGDAAISSYVFRRTHHGWEMIASAVAIIPFADFESRPVDPKALDTYLGVWTVAPGSSTVTLTREGDKLMAQGSNETEKTELLALADNTFVVRGDSDVITFEKRPDGNIIRMLFRDIGGSVQVYERSITDRKYE